MLRAHGGARGPALSRLDDLGENLSRGFCQWWRGKIHYPPSLHPDRLQFGFSMWLVGVLEVCAARGGRLPGLKKLSSCVRVSSAPRPCVSKFFDRRG